MSTIDLLALPYDEAVREFKRRYIVMVLELHRGIITRAAAHMGVHRNTLARTMDELGMQHPRLVERKKRPKVGP